MLLTLTIFFGATVGLAYFNRRNMKEGFLHYRKNLSTQMANWPAWLRVPFSGLVSLFGWGLNHRRSAIIAMVMLLFTPWFVTDTFVTTHQRQMTITDTSRNTSNWLVGVKTAEGNTSANLLNEPNLLDWHFRRGSLHSKAEAAAKSGKPVTVRYRGMWLTGDNTTITAINPVLPHFVINILWMLMIWGVTAGLIHAALLFRKSDRYAKWFTLPFATTRMTKDGAAKEI